MQCTHTHSSNDCVMQELPGVQRPRPLSPQEHQQLNSLMKRLNDIGEVCLFLIPYNI